MYSPTFTSYSVIAFAWSDFIFSNYENSNVSTDNGLNSTKFSRYETTRELSELIKGVV